jgi:hypothetical protein
MLPNGKDSRQRRAWAVLAGVFGCELAAGLALAIAHRPGLALLFFAGALWIGMVGLRRFRHAARAACERQLADVWTGAARAAADGSTEVAIGILETARARTGLNRQAARLLVELHANSDDLARAVEVAVDHLDLLEPNDLRNMIASLEVSGERRYATALTAAMAAHRLATLNSAGNGNRRLPSMRTG